MIQDALSINICFELNNTPKNFKLTDDTDYTTEGIALTDVRGLFKITAPDGSIAYENAGYAASDFTAPDIDADVSLINSLISLPLDSNGDVQLGNYVVEYKIDVAGAVQTGVYDKSFSVENCHIDPLVDIDFTIDCFNSNLTSTDNTDYGTELAPTPTSVTRTHTAYAPPTTGLSDTVTSNKILVASPIATKTWTLGISTVVQWDYPDGLCVISTIVGETEAEVVCDVSICDIFCCIDKLYNRYKAALATNSVLASEIKTTQLDVVALDLVLFQKALECGRNDKAQAYYDHILEVSGCEPGCSCSDDDVSVVIPVCVVAGTTVVDACGNGAITVTANTIGNTTTYTVCFQQALLDRLNALFNTTLTAGAGISVTPTVQPNGDVDYVIANTAGAKEESLLSANTDFDLGGDANFVSSTYFTPAEAEYAALSFTNTSGGPKTYIVTGYYGFGKNDTGAGNYGGAEVSMAIMKKVGAVHTLQSEVNGAYQINDGDAHTLYLINASGSDIAEITLNNTEQAVLQFKTKSAGSGYLTSSRLHVREKN